MLLVGLFGNLAAQIGQVEEKVLIHREEAALLQGCHRMAHAGFCDLHVPGYIYGAHQAAFLLENKDSLQVVLPGRMKFHLNLLIGLLNT